MLRTFTLLLAIPASLMFAQRGYNERPMQATITGGGGNTGKCTVEVNVDQSADVEVVGSTARVRTLAGQPSEFRRMQCTGPIPSNPADFRFRGVDGRGSVQLVRDPRQNRGVAVVHIEDPQGGREGYTFDLEWNAAASGYNGGYGNGQYNNGPYPNNDRFPRDRYNDPNYRDDRYRDRGRFGGNQNVITCSSDDGRRNYCNADTRDGVVLLKQRSDSPCRQGSTWGYDRRGIWVDRGCRAEFQVGR